MVLRAGALALAACLASPVSSQTIEETVTQIKNAVDWSGRSSSNTEEITSVRVHEDGCTIRVGIELVPDGHRLSAQAMARVVDIDQNAIRIIDGQDWREVVLESAGNRTAWQTTLTMVASSPEIPEVRAAIASGEAEGACAADRCTIRNDENRIEIPVFDRLTARQERALITSFRNLAALCRQAATANR
ncbi:hypothetical protein AADZ90_012900 [Aestuariibius sp. 2305UL40-4]|uniref:hypothetical protein n=1 Tax=Aestuariibius violaceus TaxID=3234132 RepID=UPI00345EABFF